MNQIIDKVPLKNRTAWNHLRTLQRARDAVKDWPEWKKTALVFRERSRMQEATETARTDSSELKERSA